MQRLSGPVRRVSETHAREADQGTFEEAEGTDSGGERGEEQDRPGGDGHAVGALLEHQSEQSAEGHAQVQPGPAELHHSPAQEAAEGRDRTNHQPLSSGAHSWTVHGLLSRIYAGRVTILSAEYGPLRADETQRTQVRQSVGRLAERQRQRLVFGRLQVCGITIKG